MLLTPPERATEIVDGARESGVDLDVMPGIDQTLAQMRAEKAGAPG
jgi:hypothetical protein